MISLSQNLSKSWAMNPGAHLSTGSLQGVGDFGLWALEGGRVIEFVASYIWLDSSSSLQQLYFEVHVL